MLLHLNNLLKKTLFNLLSIQVHYGLYIEWDIGTGGIHQVPDSAKRAWLALVVVSSI